MPNLNTVYFGCGCFWTKEYLFGRLTGVVSTRTGYMGGTTSNPTYQEVCQKDTGHAEVVEVSYDENLTDLKELLKAFFSFHDATRDQSENGGQYRSVVFWRKQEQKELLEETLRSLKEAEVVVSTSLEEGATFWEAEVRHQKYVERTGRHCNLSLPLNLDALSIIDTVRKRVS